MHPRKLESRVLLAMNQANRDFGLIREGDRILVAMSGGKDSYGLLWGLLRMQAAAPFEIKIVAYHLDQGQPGHDVSPLDNYLKKLEIPYEIEYQDTYTRVVEKTEPGKVYCSLCSRFRRAILYRAARRHGCNKVALGHHREDLLETLLLNLFFSGQLKTMPPRLRSDDGDEEVIRPLAYVPEAELLELSQHHNYPIMPCRLCGSQDSQRKMVKQLLEDLSVKHPRLRTSMLAALGNIRKTHVLDKSINPLFSGLATGEVPIDDEDDDSCGTPAGQAATELVQLRTSLLG